MTNETRRTPPNAQTAFTFQFRPIPELPRLAWCARVSRQTETIVVEHGPWVEGRESFFVEGAWDGPYDAGQLNEATVFLGSGGQIGTDGAVFYTTSHTMERLQSATIGDDLFISNSFAYLLAAIGDSLDVNHRFYERDLMTFLKGRTKATRIIRTAKKRQIRLYYGEAIHIDGQLNVRLAPYPDAPSFTTYDDYIAVVDALVGRLHANATAQQRTVRYESLSTISSGYDSPACTVFAKKTGCKAAITFVEARSVHDDASTPPKDARDSGEQIAAYLNVHVGRFRRDSWRGRNDFPEAEFLASGSGGDDTVLAAAEHSVSGKLLFTGFLGDTLWGLDATTDDISSSRDYAYAFPAGGTLGEFRLRIGFIHLPIPLLTFTRRADMYRISHSDEMRPWKIGHEGYDRPVPRRLVESNDVPRQIYAQEKKAITEPFWLAKDSDALKAMMSPASYQSLCDYTTSADFVRRLTAISKFKQAYAPFLAPLSPAINWYGSKLCKALGLRLFPRLRTGQFRSSILFSTVTGLKFHWAIDKITPRYVVTLFGGGEAPPPDTASQNTEA